MPARFSAVACTKTSLASPSMTMKPKPFANHSTAPIASTLASKDCRSCESTLLRGRPDGAAVLLSTLMTSVTCGPRCPGATRNSSVSPGRRVLTPMPTSAVAWRKASPVPSESSTKPYLLRGLYHFTLPQTAGADGSSSCGSAGCCEASAASLGSPESSSSRICRRLQWTSLLLSTTKFLMVLNMDAPQTSKSRC